MNVLLKEGEESPSGFLVKLTDFGLSKIKTGSSAMRTRSGTARWMAPEVTSADLAKR
jgi:serine/threonine protein kinase